MILAVLEANFRKAGWVTILVVTDFPFALFTSLLILKVMDNSLFRRLKQDRLVVSFPFCAS